MRLADGLYVGVLPLLQFAVAVAVIGALQFMLLSHRARPRLPRHRRRSRGRATDGPRQPPRLRAGDGAVAGGRRRSPACFSPCAPISIRRNGPARLIFGFEAVIIGGLGSLWGTLAGGLILGVAQAIGAASQSGLANSRRPYRLSDRACGAARRACFPRCGHERRQAGKTCVSSSAAGRAISALALVRARRRRARRRAVLGRPRRSGAAVGNLRLCGAGEPVESARRLCRPGLGRPAGLCRARRLSAVRLRQSRRDVAALGHPARRHHFRPRRDPGRGAACSGCAGIISRSAPGSSPRCSG